MVVRQFDVFNSVVDLIIGPRAKKEITVTVNSTKIRSIQLGYYIHYWRGQPLAPTQSWLTFNGIDILGKYGETLFVGGSREDIVDVTDMMKGDLVNLTVSFLTGSILTGPIGTAQMEVRLWLLVDYEGVPDFDPTSASTGILNILSGVAIGMTLLLGIIWYGEKNKKG